MVSNRLADLAAGALVQNWLILGPFVVKTGGHFEREYMYERERILDIDYLEGDGGEAAVEPVLGQRHANIGLGPKSLAWQEHPAPDLRGMSLAGEIIYETVQRNCVIYAAAAIEAEHACVGLLNAVHSGMKAWVNGELVCNAPYGRAKGVQVTPASIPIQLKKGRNLLLVKFRPGYICDGVDFTVRQVTVSPLATGHGLPIALGAVRPLPYFTGTVDEPRQVIQAALLNTSNVVVKARVSLRAESLKAEDSAEIVCAPNQVTTVRLSLATPRKAAGTAVKAALSARLYGETIETAIEYAAATPPKYDGTNFVLSAFHFDTTYHEEQRVYAMGAFEIVRQYCALHRQDPNFRSIISEVDYLKPYFDVYPEDRETLLAAFREGRAEADVMYNQPNEQNCGGEALVRNFLYGQLFHGRVLGNICRVYGPGDVFGHPNQLSQISRKSGCTGVSWDKHIFNFPPFFDHLALDGVGLPQKRGGATEDDVHAMGLSVRSDNIDQTPPTDWHEALVPKYRQGTLGDLVAAISDEVAEKGAHLPVTSRDMALYHAATAMSRTNLKIGNRLGENVLIAAEKWATVANLLGAPYPEKALDKAWRQILCGQHHDSITGTHNEISYVDLMNSYRETLELGSDVLCRSLDYLGKAIDPGKAERPLVVFNSMAWERTDVVRMTVNPQGMKSFALQDHTGKNVPFEVANIRRNRKGGIDSANIVFVARKLPSLGYRAYKLVTSSKSLPEVTPRTGAVIENEFYRIEVDPNRGGGISSLYDKKAGREVLDQDSIHVGNEVAVLQEVPDRLETQHEFYTTGLKMFSSEYAAEVTVEKGAVSATIRVKYALDEVAGAIQEITLFKGVKRVEFRTILLDWQPEDYLFCVTFPTNLKGAVPVFDERFGVVARNESKGYLDFRTHRQCMFSDCAVYAANKWMELGSTAELRMGRNAYALSMVGLITPENEADVRIAEEMQRTMIKKGVTCTPWFDKDGPHWGSYVYHMDEDLLYTRFRISIGARGKNAYTRKLLKAQPAKVRKAFDARLKKNGHAFLFVKDGDLLDKSWPAVPVLIIEAANQNALAEACGGLLAEFPKTAAIKLPAEIDATGERHTVDDYGVAVINEGTYANSVEKDGVICMMLAHTCQWYGGTNNFPEGYLVPEQKNHVFRYALYPHQGDWRKADTQRAGHDFNHPLVARETKPAAKPCLPPEQALLSVKPKNVILAAMKPYGNPIASFEKNAVSDAAQGIALRLYDTEGVDTRADVAFGAGVKQAWTADLLEERQADLSASGKGIALDVPAFSIETVGFVPEKLGRKMGKKSLGAEAEQVQPVWVRSWEHDAESMPLGYEPVVCSISREVHEEDGGKRLKLRVNCINDFTDADVAGKAEILVPDGWAAEPNVVSYQLGPLAYQSTDVLVTRPEADASGQVKLRHTYDGQVFQDVLEIGESFELDMEVKNAGDVIEVTVTNPTTGAVDGEVALVTPIETWPRDVAGPYSLLDISPRTQPISLDAGASVTLKYTVTSTVDHEALGSRSYWAVAKLMSNGRIVLKRCDERPGRRLQSDGTWLDALRERELARRSGDKKA